MNRGAFFRFVVGLCCLSGVIGGAATAADCGGPNEACQLESGRSYHVLAPDGWDGVSKLPVLMHFHGWGRTGADPVRNDRIAGATRTRGVLLVSPNGLRKSWNFWTERSDDIGFASEVLADVAKRYPLDRSRIYLSGYSYGSAMAWRYSCQNGAGVAALLGIAGTLDQEETCPEAPREVRHVHGLKDTVMDFPYGPDGDRDYPVHLWRQRLGCGEASDGYRWSAEGGLSFDRTVWTDCSAGSVRLDLHEGGHLIPRGWLARQLDELLGQPSR